MIKAICFIKTRKWLYLFYKLINFTAEDRIAYENGARDEIVVFYTLAKKIKTNSIELVFSI